MSKEEIVLRLVEKVFSLEDKYAGLLGTFDDVQKGIGILADERDKAREANETINNEFIRENKRRIEVEERMVELEKELKRAEQAFAAFGIRKNDIGFWQDKDQTMD